MLVCPKLCAPIGCCGPGQVSEPRPGAAQQAPPHGQEPRPEPLPVPGLVRAQPGVQCHVLHPGASCGLHQPPERPLDPPGLRSAAPKPHLLVSVQTRE